LACPYSHPSAEVKQQRFEIANKVAAKLMREGYNVFSPISHTHSIAIVGGLPEDWEFWEKYDRMFLGMTSELWVIRIDGWYESKGVRAEMVVAVELKIPIRFCDENGEEVTAW